MKKKLLKVTCGSLTVEAALVLPVFIFIIIAFMYFLQIIRIQENIQNAITETGYFTAKYAYVYDYVMKYEKEGSAGYKNIDEKEAEYETEGKEKSQENSASILDSSMEAAIAMGIDSTYYKVKLGEYLNVTNINHSCIENGFNGVHTYLSGFMREDNAIDIIVTYNIRLPLLFINIKDIPVMQRVRMRGWNGHEVTAKNPSSDTDQENPEMVYITETGTVYHLYKDCTYLKLSIKEVDFDQIAFLRNDSGGKYKKCSLCSDNGDVSGHKTVYITNTGDRYHYNLSCSGLKRTIITIRISETGDRSLCTRCKAKKK